ncbi:hypothetical protein [Clostridium beijerinckii]|jgi:hypothetical protein|uniref:hypothetical protein n=1 Tax=Clostridium beijerinckii TaxID=1520 RepID=UPI001360C5C4|nr:hypothetical protein [Clostridium beijerinckii]MZK53146.1 hypothetical protein [Clostridium beijerinckii]MZK61216.1 hypothetical protein [Clostridium beijerinckii]MZK71415.1 hypothetical protein [Clostridium beijerinckii]MZK76813.1 hypothetical protein [Clostridium beijerinckii]MZK86482.1 hypothetical protein [Clostridium beijerinckii]
MNNYKRPPKKKNEKPITGEIFFPETEEGKKLLYEGSAIVVLNILERKLGAEKLDKVMKLYEAKINQKS